MNDHQIIPLALLLERMVQVDTRSSSPVLNAKGNADVQSFLVEKSISFEKRHLSCTYLLVRELDAEGGEKVAELGLTDEEIFSAYPPNVVIYD